MITKIKKRDGTLVDFDAEKLNKWADWSAGIGVEWGTVALGACRKCFDGCTTDDLHNALISECVDRETTAHLRMAGRLFIGMVYKKAFGDWREIPSVRTMYNQMVRTGLWEEMGYTDSELDECDAFINHELDMNATLTESKQIMDKYAITDRVDKKWYESPQMVYMRMALGNMKDMPKERRMEDVESLYYGYSRKLINPPTPFSINLGTPKRQYSSCCVVTTKDTAASLAAADHIAYMMTCASAGIGMHLKTRSKGDKVRSGAIVHQGKLPYYKVQQAVVAANLQSSRGGANTMHFNVLDPELMDLLKLKNVQTVADKRIKDIDYSWGSNALFAQKVAKNEDWMLVSYGDAPELYEAMYSGDQTAFERLYAVVEADVSIPKQIVSARSIAIEALKEGYETGRMYLHFTDEMNRHTSFKDTIYSSNLCVAPETEILTDTGYKVISEVSGRSVNVWNGLEWSNVEVFKTGEGQKLITVTTDNGKSLTCTPYHKFYIAKGYNGTLVETVAGDLTLGDKLMKFDFPLVDGEKELKYAYENGIFTADGCEAIEGVNNQQVILMNDKVQCESAFTLPFTKRLDQLATQGRLVFTTNMLQSKYFVPSAEYTIISRLSWFSGFIDGDGCVTGRSITRGLQASSVNREFLYQVQTMLNTLGVECKVMLGKAAGKQVMPVRYNGSGCGRVCDTKDLFVLYVGQVEMQKLRSLGLRTVRLNFGVGKPQRSSAKFVTVSGVADTGRVDDTYCFTEPKRHMGVFNGILTGQCQEIALPTGGYDSVADLYKE